MLKNLDLGRRSTYAGVVAALTVVGVLALEVIETWWMVSLIAALGLPATLARSARLNFPHWLAFLTLIPGVGIVVAAVLLVAAPVRRIDIDADQPAVPRFSAVAAGVLTTVVIGVAFTFLSTNVLGQYGWALFVSLPFVLGLVTAVVATAQADQPVASVLAAAVTATTLTGVALLLLSLEGAICLIMAAPIAIPLALLGATAALALRRLQRTRALLSVAVILPALIVGEPIHATDAGLQRVTTQVVVAASPGVVWKHVISFPSLPPPRDLVFRLGAAYPIGARIDGRGSDAIRRCRFSTGDFVEPITVWNEPRRLAFDVSSQPRPMTELSPYRSVHAPHLDGFLESVRGEFRLEPLPGGRTALIGTTWYRNRMWPASYWQLWSDAIIQRIHRRVLHHVQQLAEADARRDGDIRLALS